ncbi:MAG: uracil phosphoribosyltransferase [Bacteroidales bacterium]|jgi:uracil phosphoribosyltransferase|nr:uracil phosphoribosyltransferase [Bacteroidales bacterium]
MKIVNLSDTNSILNQFIAEMRDKVVQKDSLRFRYNLERIGGIFAYEISKTLNYSSKNVETPLGIASIMLPTEKLVIGTILRAGLPLHNGILKYYDKAENSFVSAYRKYGKDNKFTIQVEYASSPGIDGKTLILADTMLATGASINLAYNRLSQDGAPAKLHIVAPIASISGLNYLKKSLPGKTTTIWVGAIDEELTNKSYIVPGLGDAGDLAYGSKN